VFLPELTPKALLGGLKGPENLDGVDPALPMEGKKSQMQGNLGYLILLA
jgi:hypothetical protein